MATRRRAGIRLINDDHVFDAFTKNVISIDKRVDILVINGNIFSGNISLLQRNFGFDSFVRAKAKEAIETIKGLDIVENLEYINKFENAKKMTNAKKLMQIMKSRVLLLDKGTLLERLMKHHLYSDLFTFVDGRIQVKTKQNVIDLLRMLNDELLFSELTMTNYAAGAKVEIGA